jgi:hypothetical protein
MSMLILNGSVCGLQPSRTFVDGQLFREVSLVSSSGERQQLHAVFCSNRLLDPMHAPGPKEIYIWNNHVFAIRTSGGLIEDVAGVRRSFLYRDWRLLLLLAITGIMLPYVAWIAIKKVRAVGSLPQVRNGNVVS